MCCQSAATQSLQATPVCQYFLGRSKLLEHAVQRKSILESGLGSIGDPDPSNTALELTGGFASPLRGHLLFWDAYYFVHHSIISCRVSPQHAIIPKVSGSCPQH